MRNDINFLVIISLFVLAFLTILVNLTLLENDAKHPELAYKEKVEFIEKEIERECDPLRTQHARNFCENYQWNRIK